MEEFVWRYVDVLLWCCFVALVKWRKLFLNVSYDLGAYIYSGFNRSRVNQSCINRLCTGIQSSESITVHMDT